MLIQPSSSTQTSSEKLFSELNKNLRQLNASVCCQSSDDDYELFMACDSVTGAPVIVTYGYDSTGALTITYTNIDGTPAANTVTKCPEKDYELLNFQWFCNNTTLESISRTDLYINGVFDSYIWQDIAGNVIPTPLPTTYTIGACQAPLPVKQERDLEKICYTLDGGLTTQSGWKRFTEIYDQNTNSYIASSFEILDINSNVLPTAIEAKCPEYTYLPVCDNVIATLNNGVVNILTSGHNPDDITFSFANFLVDPTDSLVSDIFISYDCEVTNLNGLLGPIPSITVVFKDIPNNINFPAGTYIFKRLTKTLLGFEYLQVITVNWDGTNFATSTTTITSNSNMGVVNQYVISSTHIYSVLDADGTFVKYITSDGATYTPSYNIGDCVESLTTKYTNDCVNISGSTYNFIPVYEYRQLVATSFSAQVGSSNLIQIDEGDIRFTPSSDVYNICVNDYELVQDTLITNMFYEDSLGRSFEINGSTTINFANYPKKTIKARIHSYRSSGYKQIEEFIITVDSSSKVSGASVVRVYTNTNVSNIQDTIVMNGIIPTPYEIMVKDILEVRKNGEFEKYVDLSHNDYTPTYCLSYNPVMPFTSLDVPELKVNYDEVEYVKVTASTLSVLPDTVHTISILSSGGKTDISGAGVTTASLLDGQSITFPFSTLNKNTIDITPASNAYVSLIKPR